MERKETDDRAFKFKSKPHEDFLDEEEHSYSHQEKKDNFGSELAKIFEEIPLAWLGTGALLILIIVVLFFFSSWNGVDKKQISAIENRLTKLENKIAALENINDGITRMNDSAANFDRFKKRFDQTEAALDSRMDHIDKNFELLQKQMVQARPQKSEPSKTAATAQKMDKKQYHTVVHGETLFGISRKYGLSVNDLRRLNKLDDKAEIQPGQKLLVGP
jgi:LysM repeat protein